ncbi:MAG: glycoside hydrolase domain-containing protein [Acidobacteriaceae bacterium]
MSAIQIIYGRWRGTVLLSLLILLLARPCTAQSSRGFDRNDYPAAGALAKLRQSFAWAGYWLNNPPGEQSNSWQGKRATLAHASFGFALLFKSKTSQELISGDARASGTSDGNAAAQAALREGFRTSSIIFLDIEEGGRLLPRQKAYLFAWADAVKAAGFGGGVYCSGIAVHDGSGRTITTAQDITQSEATPALALWVARDECPPSPGCVAHAKLTPAQAGTPEAVIWQYAQSPRRPQFAASCKQTYAADNACYAPGTQTFVDLNVASSPDPSHTRQAQKPSVRK